MEGTLSAWSRRSRRELCLLKIVRMFRSSEAPRHPRVLLTCRLEVASYDCVFLCSFTAGLSLEVGSLMTVGTSLVVDRASRVRLRLRGRDFRFSYFHRESSQTVPTDDRLVQITSFQSLCVPREDRPACAGFSCCVTVSFFLLKFKLYVCERTNWEPNYEKRLFFLCVCDATECSWCFILVNRNVEMRCGFCLFIFYFSFFF